MILASAITEIDVTLFDRHRGANLGQDRGKAPL